METGGYRYGLLKSSNIITQDFCGRHGSSFFEITHFTSPYQVELTSVSRFSSLQITLQASPYELENICFHREKNKKNKNKTTESAFRS